jgi:alkylation response protein AidB-like acyl-CoA dehydrogenase
MDSAPVDDIWLTLTEAAGLDEVLGCPRWREVSPDLAHSIVEEAARFSASEIVPLRTIGDTVGAVRHGHDVVMPPGWGTLYRRWIDGGWNGITAPEAFGGQGLPMALGIAALDLWNVGSMAFAVGPTLTMGAVETLHAHAGEALKARYLEKLVAGTWMATMNLTEPQAGSDLSGVRTRAEPVGDGSYRLFGQKIFITYGEHDLTDNIVHLVLARLEGAPAGTRGISLFLVPKVLPDGKRNDVVCAGLEHKLGIHASPTCTMAFGDGAVAGMSPGAIGWLVGEANRGLNHMFTMMNNARLAIGIQGVGVGEAATQKALAYAKDRRQGRAPNETGEGASAIAAHADVRRNLLTMRALTMAARAICYACAAAIDLARAGPAERNAHWQARANLLTPIAKAFSTDIGVEVASLGVQVHGGMGFVEETGAAMLLRDARIAPIYEGTNGIQAIDLVTRKLPVGDGADVRGFISELRRDVARLNESALRPEAPSLARALDDLDAATTLLLDRLGKGEVDAALAGATPYLRLFALALGGCLLGRMAIATERADPVDAFRFYARNLVGETGFRRGQVAEGAASVVAVG